MKIIKSMIVLFAGASITLSSCKKEKNVENSNAQAEQDVAHDAQYAGNNWEAIPGQYIVTFKEDANENARINSTENYEEKARMVAESNKKVLARLNISESAIKENFTGHLKGFAGKLTKDQVAALKKDPTVNEIEQDRIISLGKNNVSFSIASTQSIPWGISRVGYTSNYTGTKTAWIIDSGVDLDHPDLNVDVARSRSFIRGTTADDGHGHGTHVAGTIAAKNNTYGVIGVAANAKVVSLRVLDATGSGSLSAVISAVDYVSAYARPGDVVNMSLGGGISYTLDSKVYYTSQKGIYFAVAAGNSAVSATLGSPARVNGPYIYTVSAMNNADTWASFSNFGTPVDYCAPGVNIYSTYKDGGYGAMSGTSMATPHVAGLLILNGRYIVTNGYVIGDPDGVRDRIAHR